MRTAFFTLILAATLTGQDAFTNFETPVVKGLTAATIAGNTWVVACNPDDHSVSVIDATTEALVQRVRVGLGPCSLFYDAPAQKIYTANHLGDSVSILEVTNSATDPLRLLTTQWVGDEPTDLAIRRPTGGPTELWVLLASSSRIARFDPNTLGAAPSFWGTHDLPVLDSWGSPNPVVMKYPYRLIIHNDQAFILNLRGRTNVAGGAGSAANLELVRWDFGGGVVSAKNTLGTSHMGMAVASNGTLYVVGNNAQNNIKGEPQLRGLASGFVESHFWAHDMTPANTVDRDLNSGAIASNSVSMPTDVTLIENASGVERAFLASFSTDRVVEIVRGTNSNVVNGSLTVRQLTPRNSYSMAGPRSLVTTQIGNTLKLFVLCRLDAAVRVYDVTAVGGTSAATATVALNDPFPRRLREGQQLLYDARLSANANGVGTVSCASCHIDGKTDGLAWELDTGSFTSPANPPDPVPQELVDGIEGPYSINYNENRGLMVTQTLQGLRTHTARTWRPQDVHALLSTRPFYWRGKRGTFLDFGIAFDKLMGKALPDAQITDLMEKYREYAFSIMYPPNPEQPIDRVHSGNPPDHPDGISDARLGLRQFFEIPLDPPLPVTPNSVFAGDLTRGRSCVQCHAVPAGTNGMLTELRRNLAAPLNSGARNPIKAAQLRGIRARESRHVPFGLMNTFAPLAPVHTHGMFHDGSLTTIDELLAAQFNPTTIPQIGTLIKFLREFDTGAGPMIGRSITFDATIMSQWAAQLGGTTAAYNAAVGVINIAIEQVRKANCDLVVDYDVNGATASLYFDVEADGFVDPGVAPGTGTLWTVNGTNPVLPTTFGAGDRVALQTVPIGSGRRIASPAGQLVVHPNTAPSAIQSVEMTVPDPWKDVPALTNNLSNFNWRGPASSFPKHVTRMQAFQNSLRTANMLPATAPPVQYHEAPRRFRVTGTGIRPGAKLTLFLPTTWSGTQPIGFDGGTTLELYPVRNGDNVVWETSAVIQPKVLYAMANGWFSAPGVAQTYGSNPLGTGMPAGPMDPTNFNRVLIAVSNEDPSANPPLVQEPAILFFGPIVLE